MGQRSPAPIPGDVPRRSEITARIERLRKMRTGIMTTCLILVLGISTVSSAVDVAMSTSDPGWAYPELADPEPVNGNYPNLSMYDQTPRSDGDPPYNAYFNGKYTGPGERYLSEIFDEDTTIFGAGDNEGSNPWFAFDFGGDVTARGLYVKMHECTNMYHELYSSGSVSSPTDLVLQVYSGSGGGSGYHEYWFEFSEDVTFRYYKGHMSGGQWNYIMEAQFYTPEPATVAILGLGSLVLLRRRRV
jgi:hypothetical protein